MGGARAYNPAGGFHFKDFEQVGDTIYYKGLVGKILRKVDGSSSGLPSRSGKSDFYALPGKKTGEIVQVKLYKDRLQSIDFDWGHIHIEGKGKNKTIFPEGVVHAHEYAKGERTGTTRYMSNEEINFFGDLFKSLNPSVKFRP